MLGDDPLKRDRSYRGLRTDTRRQHRPECGEASLVAAVVEDLARESRPLGNVDAPHPPRGRRHFERQPGGCHVSGGATPPPSSPRTGRGVIPWDSSVTGSRGSGAGSRACSASAPASSTATTSASAGWPGSTHHTFPPAGRLRTPWTRECRSDLYVGGRVTHGRSEILSVCREHLPWRPALRQPGGAIRLAVERRLSVREHESC